MKYLSRACLAVLLGALAATAQAQEFRAAYVNIDRIMREAAPAKSAQAKLEQEFARREKELNDLGQSLRSASERFEREAPAMSETQRTQRQRQLIDQDRDFQRKRRELQEDLAQRKNEELAAVLERSNRVIKQIFDTEKYDLIIQEAVFAGPRIDITDKVIKALNAQGPAK